VGSILSLNKADPLHNIDFVVFRQVRAKKLTVQVPNTLSAPQPKLTPLYSTLIPSSSFSAECFLLGDWSFESGGLPSHDPQLSSLFTQFKASLPLSRAPGTWASYKPIWDKFCAWCRTKGVKFLPASPLLVALYMTDLLRTARSPSPVLSFSGAVYFSHTLAGLPSPTSHPLVGLAREIARRTKVAGKNQKRPFLAFQNRRIISAWAGPSAPLHPL
jgi:hypothetical protein